MNGSEGKPFHAGRAASAGVLSALLAKNGFEAAIDAIGSKAGYLYVVGSHELAAESTDELVARWSKDGLDITRFTNFVREGYFKRHAACGATHNLIEAVGGLVSDNKIVPDEIDRIDADVFRHAVLAAGHVNPTTGLDGNSSLTHTAAQAAFAHPLTEEWFTSSASPIPR